MDNQIENHLPLITSRLVFAVKDFPSPPTISHRMEFPSINIEARDDSPVPENGGHQNRAGTPVRRAATPSRRAATPSRRAATPSRRAATPSRREVTPSRRATTPKRASTPKASANAHGPLRRSNTVGLSSAQENRVAFDKNMDVDSLTSPLTSEDEDMDELEETSGSEEEDDVIDGEGVGEKLIPKPKGEVGRPGRGGYNLVKALSWNQKIYDSVQVSKCGVYMKESISHQPITRHSSQRLLGISLTQHKAIEGRARRK